MDGQHRSTSKCLISSVCLLLRSALCVFPFFFPSARVCLEKLWKIDLKFDALNQLPSAASLPLHVQRTKALQGPHLLTIPLSPCLSSSLHDSVPLGFFSCLTLIYFSLGSAFVWLCPSIFKWWVSAAQIQDLRLPNCVIMLSHGDAVLLVLWASAPCLWLLTLPWPMRLWKISSQET